jgi:hypothetical protein
MVSSQGHAHQVQHALAVGHIQLHHQVFRHAYSQFRCRLRVSLDGNDLAALCRKSCGNGLTDATSGARDDGHLVVQPHDLTAPAVSPWIKKRCKNANPITTGRELTIDAAMAPPQSLLLSPM